MTDFNLDVVLRLAELAAIVGGGGTLIFKLGRATERMELSLGNQATAMTAQNEQIKGMQSDIRALNDLVTKVALQNQRLDIMGERINTLDKRYEELRHGEGFVYPLAAHLGKNPQL